MNIEDIKKPENIVYKKTPILTDNVMHYCPGCSHGTVHKLVAEVIEDMGIQDQTIAISPVGCSVFAYNYLNIDWQQAAHGRAPALATATKRLQELSGQVKSMMSIELNLGQMVDDVKLAVNGKCPVGFYGRQGGIIYTPDEIAEEFKKFNNLK